MSRCHELLCQLESSSAADPPESACEAPTGCHDAAPLTCSHCGSERLILLEERPKPSWRDLLSSTSENCPGWYAHLQQEADRRYWDGLMGEGFSDWYQEMLIESAKETARQPASPPPGAALTARHFTWRQLSGKILLSGPHPRPKFPSQVVNPAWRQTSTRDLCLHLLGPHRSQIDPPPDLLAALGVTATYVGRTQFDHLVVVEAAETVRSLSHDIRRLNDISTRGVIVTSRSDDTRYDFVSRFFAPALGIDEDPVTGAAHCWLAPYWAHVLGKTEMAAYQASARGGIVQVRVLGDRVVLGGQAVTVWQGDLLSVPWPVPHSINRHGAVDLTDHPLQIKDDK